MYRLLEASPETADFHRKRHEKIMDACAQWQPNGTAIHAGFTYWGQFLAHELGPRPGQEPVRTGHLDLDSVYGKDVPLDAEKKFRVEREGMRPIDLPRNDSGAMIADSRNDENLLVAQFHLLLLRLHNALATTLMQEHSAQPQDAFDQARRFTIRIFHQTTREQFLRKVLWPSVYDFLFKENDTLFEGEFELKNTNQLPVEVVLGALRFGHSMIRDAYGLNSEQQEVSLDQLFQLTGAGELSGTNQLRPEFAVEWRHFFDFGPMVPINSAEPIDLRVTPAMTEVHDIVEKNLQQGYQSELPSGQQAVDEILEKRPGLADRLGLIRNPRPMIGAEFNMGLLEAAGIAECAPFWLFTLLDSTREGSAGRSLGPFGSLFVGSALKWAMEEAEAALKSAGPGLPAVEEVNDVAGQQFNAIQDVIAFVETVEGTQQ